MRLHTKKTDSITDYTALGDHAGPTPTKNVAQASGFPERMTEPANLVENMKKNQNQNQSGGTGGSAGSASGQGSTQT